MTYVALVKVLERSGTRIIIYSTGQRTAVRQFAQLVKGDVRMKLIIAGSRTITSYPLLRSVIIQSGLWEAYGRSIVVISGAVKGVDKLGEQFAAKAGLKVLSKPANWEDVSVEGAVVKYNAKGPYNAVAGHMRNQDMADIADGGLILWDGVSKGSLDMLHRLLQESKPVWLYAAKITDDKLEKFTSLGAKIILPTDLQSA